MTSVTSQKRVWLFGVQAMTRLGPGATRECRSATSFRQAWGPQECPPAFSACDRRDLIMTAIIMMCA